MAEKTHNEEEITTSFTTLLNQYRTKAYSERDKGDRFERLMQAYLLTDPTYTNQFSKVWLWSEFPYRKELGGSDTGIDLVSLTHDGDYWAIQCKFFAATASIDKKAVDSFLSTSSREFKDDQIATTRFAHRLWISTTNKWGINAQNAIKNQNPPVSRISLFDLQEAPVDWLKLDQGIHGEASRTAKKILRPHQKTALEKTHDYFKENNRGKLIMACGTGKTFNSLRIAENETNHSGIILFLVPSIALLGQTLREWSADAIHPIHPICICSDPKITQNKRKNADTDLTSIEDLALPASTDPENILKQFRRIKERNLPGMTVVFSTYQSIDVIAKAQKVLLKNGFPQFDLIICDEAHRTTGATLPGADESAFIKVHNNDTIQAKKRLYMTATPRLFSDDSKSKAAQSDAVLASMDDPKLYGEEIYRIGFGEAVEKKLLTDYKVLILTLNDQDIPPAVQKMIAGEDDEINADDATKLIGTINALSKQFLGDDGNTKSVDPHPMRRAVAFCQNIKVSKRVASTYNTTTDVYLDALTPEKKEEMVTISSQHIDGTMNSTDRDEKLAWLKEPTEGNECRILTNVRVLSEGVDVPSLDAVLFLSARNSPVDVVQSVGRVMRLSPGKKYGYIIIPVVVPSDIDAKQALDNNERYKAVWTVLNALRAHDDRFNATINKIDLNKKRPDQILVGRPETTFNADGEPVAGIAEPGPIYDTERQLAIPYDELQNAIFARLVKKVGNRRYWEQWAKEVAQIAERQIERITRLVSQNTDQKTAFEKFLSGLQRNINPSITKEQAIEMLAQHIITQPIFEALFEDYSFIQNNPVSAAMQGMLDALQGESLADDNETLQRFYESVRVRVSGIDNAAGKQSVITELYDKFFSTAFPKMVEQLGIVYTPVPVVDFIIHSISDVLKKEFGRSISDENVHLLDPFTGTGTFITRLLQSGLIKQEDLARKFRHEIHANEIVLLAYYIAAVNIENAYYDQLAENKVYEPFEGIVLTDTFQLGETDASQALISEMFPQNSERVNRQKTAPLRVIMGNPPYSVGQRSANDNAQNQTYPNLDGRIASTYAKESNANLKNSLYDSYFKAFRWSADRLDPEHGGIIAFVSNGAWLDGNSTDGFRRVIEKEFSSIWVFNLRGNQRTSGELSRREGGKIFGSGSRTPISITLLVKNPAATQSKALIHYHDIGDYLTRDEKLTKIRGFGSITNSRMLWASLTPNVHGDWINKRNDSFGNYIQLGNKKVKGVNTTFFIPFYSNGLKTQRDAWCYNSSSSNLKRNIQSHLDFYNDQRIAYSKTTKAAQNLPIKDFLNRDESKISWTSALERDAEKNIEYNISDGTFVIAQYRPFFKQHLFFSRALNERVLQIPKLFPNPSLNNLVICVSGVGVTKRFSTIISDTLPDLELIGKSQCFPLYYYEENKTSQPSLFATAPNNEYTRRDGVSDFIFNQAQKRYGKAVTKEDIFYYVYGLLHSSDYRTTFANDLKKMLPSLPLLDDIKQFWAFSKAGRHLADIHINYETVTPYPHVQVIGEESQFYTVEKMRFPRIDGEVRGKKKKVDDLSTIHYNSRITITDIPEKAYQYVINGKSAIHWIIERYQVKTDKKSGITNNPNDWAEEVGNPRYILDLLLSVINLSVQTVDIVNGLPVVDEFQLAEPSHSSSGGGSGTRSNRRQILVLRHRTHPDASIKDPEIKQDIDTFIEALTDLQHLIDDVEGREPAQVEIYDIAQGSVIVDVSDVNESIGIFQRAGLMLLNHWEESLKMRRERKAIQNHSAKIRPQLREIFVLDYPQANETHLTRLDAVGAKLESSNLALISSLTREEFRQVLTKKLSNSDLKKICFDLNLPFEDFAEAHSDKVVDILQYLDQHTSISQLIKWLQRNREDIELRLVSPDLSA